MDFLYAAILGLVQGITEFLPISSSGHLLLLHKLLPLPLDSELTFDVALHGGTLIAILIFFAKDIIHYFRQMPKLLVWLIVSALPAGAIGWFFDEMIDWWLRSAWVVVVMLVVVSLIFFVVEARFRPHRRMEELTWRQVLLLGCAQAVALIPGTSRSGITMATGMALGLSRPAAARFSFLMIIPLLLGLVGKQAVDLAVTPVTTQQWSVMAVGAAVAAIIGVVVIKYLLRFLQKYTLKPFAWYRLILAAIVSLLLLL